MAKDYRSHYMMDDYMYIFYGNANVVRKTDQMASDDRYLEDAVRTILDKHLSVFVYGEPLEFRTVVAEKSYAQIWFTPVDDVHILYLKNLSVDSFSFALVWLEMSHYNSRARLLLLNKIIFKI
ncbi:hypothetical protein ACRQTN_05205 [Pectobacterium brasiliense]|uniref:hypothetical protein n=1 Tax=Pectobacterium brasiliense TaxID=180957 RepID=UPI003EB69E73